MSMSEQAVRRDRDKHKLVRVIGARMKLSREMNNMTLGTASARLGYANSAKLSKIEHASDGGSIPLLTIRDAAQLYSVSADYLFGLSDDWEITLRSDQDINKLILEHMEVHRNQVLRGLAAVRGKHRAVDQSLTDIVQVARELIAAAKVMQSRNSDYEDWQAGSAFWYRLGLIETAVSKADSAIKRFRIDADLAGGAEPQLELIREQV